MIMRDIVDFMPFLGSVLQVIGTLLMANGYTGVTRTSHLVRLLAGALVRSSVARGAVELSQLTQEDKIKSLQGLALIGLGFTVQAVGMIIAISTGN